MATVRITVDGRDAYVRSPFSAKDIIRDMPERKWNPALKVWIIPASDVAMLTAALEAAGFTVDVADNGGASDSSTAGGSTGGAQSGPKPPPNDGPSPWARRGAGASWADDMFAALGPELSDKAYKALSRVLHPDVGGDTVLMQLVNVAHDKARKAA